MDDMARVWSDRLIAAWADRVYTKCADLAGDEYKGVLFSACTEAVDRFNMHQSAGCRMALRYVKDCILAAKREDEDARPPFVVDGEDLRQQLSLQAWDNVSEDDRARLRALERRDG